MERREYSYTRPLQELMCLPHWFNIQTSRLKSNARQEKWPTKRTWLFKVLAPCRVKSRTTVHLGILWLIVGPVRLWRWYLILTPLIPVYSQLLCRENQCGRLSEVIEVQSDFRRDLKFAVCTVEMMIARYYQKRFSPECESGRAESM